MADRFLSVLARRGTLTWYIEMVTAVSEWIGGIARPHGRARLRQWNLLDDLNEDEQQPDDGSGPGQRAQPRQAGQIDHGVGEAEPEEQRRAQHGRGVPLAEHRDGELERGE